MNRNISKSGKFALALMPAEFLKNLVAEDESVLLQMRDGFMQSA